MINTNLHQNLIAYWPMNGHTTNVVNKQNSIDTDISYDTTNDAITFNGSSSKIAISEVTTIKYPGEYTFSFWIYPIQNVSAPGDGLGGLFVATVPGGYGFVYYSDYPTYQLVFSSTVITATAPSMPFNQWNHIVMTISYNAGYGMNVLDFYINGVIGGQQGRLNATIYLEKFGEYAGFYLENGVKLKDFYIWDRKLTNYEIQRMYHKENIFTKHIYDNDLISHWTLNSSIKNYTGIPNIGSTAATTYELGIKETSIRFNSATPTNITGAHAAAYNTTTITCNAWIKPYSFPTNFLGIIDKYLGSTSGFYLDIESSTAKTVRFGIRSASTDYWINTTTQLSINNWYMVTGIYDGSKLKIYINGILEAEATISATINFNTHNVIIGGDNVSTLYFNGLIQNVGIWNKALDSYEINCLHNQSSRSLYNKLLAFWKLDGNGNDLLNQYNTSTDNNITYNNTATRHTAVFNGSSSYYIAPTLTPLAGSSYLSISLWFYTSVNDECVLISEYSTTINNNVFFVSLEQAGNNTIRFGVIHTNGDSGNQLADTNIGAYSLNKWNHLVCIFDGAQEGNSNKCKMYVNGTQLSLNFTGTWGSIVNTNITYPVWIGSLFNNPSLTFNGQMDNIGIWNKALTERDIETLYEDGLQLPSAYKIVNYWPLQSDTVSEIGTNTGIASNITYSSGRINNAATFNGASSYIYVNQIDSTLITFACWFKTNSTALYQSIVRQGYIPLNYDLRIDDTGQYVAFLVGGGGNQSLINTGYYVTIGAWTHVTATYDWLTNTFKLYENGILKLTQSFLAAGVYGFNNTTQGYNYTDIGRNINNFNSYFNGQIDEIIIWNRILTDSEVQDAYSKTFKQPIIP